jgi:hypothetical protein
MRPSDRYAAEAPYRLGGCWVGKRVESASFRSKNGLDSDELAKARGTAAANTATAPPTIKSRRVGFSRCPEGLWPESDSFTLSIVEFPATINGHHRGPVYARRGILPNLTVSNTVRRCSSLLRHHQEQTVLGRLPGPNKPRLTSGTRAGVLDSNFGRNRCGPGRGRPSHVQFVTATDRPPTAPG